MMKGLIKIMTSKNELVKIMDISKEFKGKSIFSNINLSISEGDIIGFLGLNGQGKTTLIKCLLGLTSIDSGNISIVLDKKKEFGVMLQEVAVPQNVRVEEVIQLVRHFSDQPMDLESILYIANLSDKRTKITQTLSGGEKRRVQFAAAIANNPKFLILDEPTVGMDLISKENFWKEMKDFALKEQRAILLVSHDLEEVEEVANRIVILHNQKIRIDCQITELNQSVKEKFREVIQND